MRKLKNKKYSVNVSMPWSKDINVTAKSIGEAKKKAFARFKKVCAKHLFQLNAERSDTGGF